MRALLTMAFIVSAFAGSAQSLQQIESVEYDEANQRWLVSNSTNIIAQDHFGNLSVFGSGEAGYGMEIVNNTLFGIVSFGNTNEVHGYDLSSGDEVMSLSISAGFLNGMATNGSDKLWVTDFGNQRIIEIDISDLQSPSYTTLVDLSVTPNGVVFDAENNRLVFVCWGLNAPIYEYRFSDSTLALIQNSGLNYLDGIDMNSSNEFFVASWSPANVRKYSNDFSSQETIITNLDDPADICYATAIDSLAIPNSGNATLTIIGFGTTAVDEQVMEASVQVYPNPATDFVVIELDLASAELVRIKAFDASGKSLGFIHQGKLSAGKNRIVHDVSAWPTGTFLITVEGSSSSYSLPLTK